MFVSRMPIPFREGMGANRGANMATELIKATFLRNRFTGFKTRILKNPRVSKISLVGSLGTLYDLQILLVFAFFGRPRLLMMKHPFLLSRQGPIRGNMGF